MKKIKIDLIKELNIEQLKEIRKYYLNILSDALATMRGMYIDCQLKEPSLVVNVILQSFRRIKRNYNKVIEKYNIIVDIIRARRRNKK